MADMSVEEAMETLRYFRRLLISEEFYEEEREAIRVVLDELKALQECKSCRCSKEGMEQS